MRTAEIERDRERMRERKKKQEEAKKRQETPSPKKSPKRKEKTESTTSIPSHPTCAREKERENQEQPVRTPSPPQEFYNSEVWGIGSVSDDESPSTLEDLMVAEAIRLSLLEYTPPSSPALEKREEIKEDSSLEIDSDHASLSNSR